MGDSVLKCACFLCYTFHLHDSIVWHVLALCLLLSLGTGLIVLLRGNNNDGLTSHAFKRTNLPLLRVRVDICLKMEGGEDGT